MTWEQIQKAALDKVFARVIHGEETYLNDTAVADYVKAMPAAANFALLDLARVRPIQKRYEVELPRVRSAHRAQLSPHVVTCDASDFWRLLPDRVYLEKDNRRIPIDDYWIDGENTLILSGSYSGKLIIWYEAYPETITENTPGETTFSLREEAQVLVPLYIASQLFREDDLSMSIQYLNEYEAGKAALGSIREHVNRGGAWRSVSGWTR